MSSYSVGREPLLSTAASVGGAHSSLKPTKVNLIIEKLGCQIFAHVLLPKPNLSVERQEY